MSANEAVDHGVLVRSAWIDHLGAEAAGPDTNFFEAGGNSLMAASLMGRLSAELEQDLPMRMLARNPTLGELSAAVRRWPEPAGKTPGDGRDRSWG
jgi:acyl carrier protein